MASDRQTATVEEFTGLIDAVQTQIAGDERWEAVLARTTDANEAARAHLAVMQEPYLGYILEGRKTVESRFSRHRVAPYQRVRSGDALLFKAVAGPVIAIAQVADVDYYVLDPTVWAQVRGRFTAALAVEDETFWEERGHARFATLMRLRAVRSLSPIVVDKRDRRGWVVLDGRAPDLHPDQLGLFGTQQPTRTRRWYAAPQSDSPAGGGGQLELEFE